MPGDKKHDIPIAEPPNKYRNDSLLAVERLKLKHLRQQIQQNQQQIKEAEEKQEEDKKVNLMHYHKALLDAQRSVCEILGTVVPK